MEKSSIFIAFLLSSFSKRPVKLTSQSEMAQAPTAKEAVRHLNHLQVCEPIFSSKRRNISGRLFYRAHGICFSLLFRFLPHFWQQDATNARKLRPESCYSEPPDFAAFDECSSGWLSVDIVVKQKLMRSKHSVRNHCDRENELEANTTDLPIRIIRIDTYKRDDF